MQPNKIDHTVTRLASPEHLDHIRTLLANNDLPTDDIDQHIQNFIVGLKGDALVGCIGLEIHGTNGLLRSLAVDQRFRNRGIAKAFYRHLLSLAAEHGVRYLHLLTTTAEPYFKRLGFWHAERTDAPESIRKTQEFTTLCSTSAVYMTKAIHTEALYFKSTNHKLKTEPNGSKYWAVKSEKMMFTWFEVAPHSTFPLHAHASEQMTYALEGELFFEVHGETFCLEPGDFISIPSNKLHRAWTQDKLTRAVDSWTPVNDTY